MLLNNWGWGIKLAVESKSTDVELVRPCAR